MRLIVFDCDGTLVDSQATIVACARAAFVANELEPPSDKAIRQIVGLSLEQAMYQLLERPDREVASRVADSYRDAFVSHRQQPDFEEPLFAGVRELLDRMHSAGILMGIATGKGMRGLTQVIEHNDLDGYFITLQTADLHPSKPHPSMMEAAMREAGTASHETVIVGDTTFDIEMGRAAGCRAIGVSYGNHSHQQLVTAGADRVIDEIAELPVAIGLDLP